MPESATFVTRGGDKLAAALDQFGVDVSNLICADLGSHAGGFVDCLLQRGAARVYSIDTSYGTLAWKLRKNPRVVVLERTNALHVELPEPVQLITIDVGWTRQSKVLAHAARLLAPDGRVISLIKPHYEADASMLEHGVLPERCFQPTLDRVIGELSANGWTVEGTCKSPMLGHGGNREVFARLSRSQPPSTSV
jgi:23S rRNA (cytidine1920-2'-O)/16S rRNA (cytidine1409-2'-O)-methyltransferase